MLVFFAILRCCLVKCSKQNDWLICYTLVCLRSIFHTQATLVAVCHFIRLHCCCRLSQYSVYWERVPNSITHKPHALTCRCSALYVLTHRYSKATHKFNLFSFVCYWISYDEMFANCFVYCTITHWVMHILCHAFCACFCFSTAVRPMANANATTCSFETRNWMCFCSLSLFTSHHTPLETKSSGVTTHIQHNHLIVFLWIFQIHVWLKPIPEQRNGNESSIHFLPHGNCMVSFVHRLQLAIRDLNFQNFRMNSGACMLWNCPLSISFVSLNNWLTYRFLIFFSNWCVCQHLTFSTHRQFPFPNARFKVRVSASRKRHFDTWLLQFHRIVYCTVA